MHDALSPLDIGLYAWNLNQIDYKGYPSELHQSSQSTRMNIGIDQLSTKKAFSQSCGYTCRLAANCDLEIAA